MRGKATRHIRAIDTVGITPAYAGKRFATVKLLPVLRDHPRLCGEKGKNVTMIGENAGSPPPMRGKGNGTHLTMSCCWDHPRLCGEKLSCI